MNGPRILTWSEESAAAASCFEGAVFDGETFEGDFSPRFLNSESAIFLSRRVYRLWTHSNQHTLHVFSATHGANVSIQQ